MRILNTALLQNAGVGLAARRIFTAILLAFLTLGGCQGTGSPSGSNAERGAGTSKAGSAGISTTPQQLVQQEPSAAWQAEKPVSAAALETESGSNLLAPEYYPGTGALLQPGTSSGASAPVLEDGRVNLNFANADIRQVIEVVLGDTLNLSYVIDPRVQGTVLARTSEPLRRANVIPALESILALNGAALKFANGVYHVVPLGEGGINLGQPRTALTAQQRAQGFSVTVIPLRFTSATDIYQVAIDLVPPGRVFLADPARNLLIFAGTGTEANDLVDFVRLFDVDWMAGMSYALFPVQVAQASILITELEQVFSPGGLDPLPDVIQFVPIERMNAVLVMSPQQSYIEVAEKWIKRLDRGEASFHRQIHVYYVQNSRAADLSEILSQILEDVDQEPVAGMAELLAPGLEPVTLRGTPTTGEAAGASDASSPELIGEARAAGSAYGNRSPRQGRDVAASVGALVNESRKVRVIADDRNNALVILATVAEYRMIEATLRQLDIVPIQVLIEATIAEVTLIDDLKYGLNWFFQEGDFTSTFSNLTSGAVTSQFPGFSLLYSSGDARAVLNALTDLTDVNVISSPQLMVLDNQSAFLNVGDQVPIAIQTQQTTETSDPGTLVSSIEYRNTGVTLEITPRVNKNGLIVLDIIQEVSDAVETSTSELNSPTIQQRRIESTVAVQSGETVALGGLIRDRRIDNVTGVPLLSDIPILGNLFKTTQEEVFRTELLVLITPRVVRNLEEARAVTSELRARMTGLSALESRMKRTTPPTSKNAAQSNEAMNPASVSELETLQPQSTSQAAPLPAATLPATVAPAEPVELAPISQPAEATLPAAPLSTPVALVEPLDLAPISQPAEATLPAAPLPAMVAATEPLEPPPISQPAESPMPARETTLETPELGSFALHLASHETREDAVDKWAELQANHPELIAEKDLAIRSVDLEDLGTYFQVLAVSFEEFEGAQNLCDKLNFRDQPCSVVPAPLSQPAEPTLLPLETVLEALELDTFALHLASLKTREAAMDEWVELQANHPELLAQKELAIRSIELEDQGTYFRVLAILFEGYEDAQHLCDRLDLRGQYCSVVPLSGRDEG